MLLFPQYDLCINILLNKRIFFNNMAIRRWRWGVEFSLRNWRKLGCSMLLMVINMSRIRWNDDGDGD